MKWSRDSVFGLPAPLPDLPAFHRRLVTGLNAILFVFLYAFRLFGMVPWLLRLGGTGTHEENATYVLLIAFVQAVFDTAMINLLVCYLASLKVDSPVLRLIMRRAIAVAVGTMPLLQLVPLFRPE